MMMWWRFFLLFVCFDIVVRAQAPTNETFTAPTSVPYPRGPDPDSEGTEFLFTFTRNAHFDELPYIAFDMINQDWYATAKVTVELLEGKSKSLPEVVFVEPKRHYRHVLASSSYIWGNLNDGLQKHPNTIVRLTSTIPIRLYGINQDDSTLQADVITILPITMAGTNYVVTLPSASREIYGSWQYHVVYFIPLNYTQPIDIQTTMVTERGIQSLASTTVTGSAYVHYLAQTGTVSRVPRTYYITSSAPIMVVAAVTCTDVITGNLEASGCDYAAYMPAPVYTQGCDEIGYSLYGADTFNTAHFYVSPPVYNCPAGTNGKDDTFVTVQQDGSTATHRENSRGYQHRLKVATMDVIGIQSDYAVLQVSRLGGVDIAPRQAKIGAFLTNVPSASQLITGIHYFYLPSTRGVLEVTGDAPQIVVDDIAVNYTSTVKNPIGTWYTFQYNITDPYSEHFVYSSGNYAATLIGYLGENAYGFELAYNKLKPGSPYTIVTTTAAPSTLAPTTPAPTTPAPATQAPTTPAVTPQNNSSAPTTTVTNTPATTITTTAAPADDKKGVSGMSFSIGLTVATVLVVLFM
uniref:IgGFc_binding domain-containing protein n=1 Tax=Panagrellus redivivus TaxID=6233 RepID=A0A7E4VB58_PANRE